MKHAPTIAGALLGIPFIAFGLMFFLKVMPDGPKPAPEALAFMGAIGPTGYLAFVKAMEILGGLLVAVPKTRNLGLLILGPIIINILCYHVFLNQGATLVDPVLIAISVLAVFLLWTERRAFAGLIHRNTSN